MLHIQAPFIFHHISPVVTQLLLYKVSQVMSDGDRLVHSSLFSDKVKHQRQEVRFVN